MDTETYLDQLDARNQHQVTAAFEANEAVQAFARTTNRVSGGVIPAPSAYSIIGNLKTLVGSLHEVTEYLPGGLLKTLSNPHLTVTDRDIYGSNAKRDPSDQIALLGAHMAVVTEALADVQRHLELAQQSIAGQSYSPRVQPLHPKGDRQQ